MTDYKGEGGKPVWGGVTGAPPQGGSWLPPGVGGAIPETMRIKQRNPNMQRKVEKQLKRWETTLGGRVGIAAALQVAEGLTPEESLVVDALTKQENAHLNIRRVIADAAPGITIGKVLRLFLKGRSLVAQALAYEKVYREIPKTAAYLMRTAVPHDATCGSCGGRKQVVGPMVQCKDCAGAGCPQCYNTGKRGTLIQCDKCQGTGTFRRDPETDRIKLALEVSGVLKPGNGKVDVQVGVSVESTIVQTSAAFRSATDKLLFTREQPALPAAQSVPAADYLEPAQDAEVVRVEPAPAPAPAEQEVHDV